MASVTASTSNFSCSCSSSSSSSPLPPSGPRSASLTPHRSATSVAQLSALCSVTCICSYSPICDRLGPQFGVEFKKSALGFPQLHNSRAFLASGQRLGAVSSTGPSWIASAPTRDHEFGHFTRNWSHIERREREDVAPRLKSSEQTEASTETETETEAEAEAEAEAGTSSKEGDGLAERGATAAVTVATVASDSEAISKVLATVEEGEEVAAADEVSPAESFITEELAAIYAKCQIWQWKDQYPINYVVQGSGPPVVLVHGFGASIGHWRRNIGVLSDTNTVYALDLLGLGASAKPPKFQYTMETWAELLIDFMREIVGSPAVLVGNSIGSLACLIASADAPAGVVRGTVLLNCAGGMNNKAVTDDWRLKLFLPLLWLIDFLLNQPSLASRLFNRVRSRANIKSVLQSVYNNKGAVDDELVEVILTPADTPGALDAFVSIITGPPGPKPQTLMPRISTPLLLIWGDDDPFTPIDGPVGKYFTALSDSAPNVQLFLLPNVGHCPHDDRPELVHEKLIPWLEALPT